ncbi:MAG TPA: RraA family protein [Xanthobacteraceae bacterium]|jgi:regulator of RNase E activity RraA|nr:RraA family protein [Xanthobacteraceae bacterium]
MSKLLTGKIDPSRICMLEIPRVAADVIARYKALGDATCAVSDALDEIGIRGIVAGSRLIPTIAGARMVGPALTLRNVLRQEDPAVLADRKDNRLAEIECHNLSAPGDVIVVQGAAGVSNLGGVGTKIGKRQGEAGAVVDGGIRDVGQSRELNYPIWSTERTPATGKWRVEAAEINGPVVICGVRVEAGDLVVADDTGVCFVPRASIMNVLLFAEKKTKAEQDKCDEVDRGDSVPMLAGVKAAK